MILENNVANFIKSKGLITDKGPVIIGVSGGPDSVALTHILYKIVQNDLQKNKLYVAHLNHKLRGVESDEDSESVKNLANQLNLPVLVKEVDIKRISKESKLSIEETARVERYKFLESCAKDNGANYVAVAHTADDNIETILQRIIRGTGMLGLSGINLKRSISPGSSITLVRPFLNIWKKDIFSYLDKKNLTYRTDSSNSKEIHFRNKLRIELLPLLEKKYNKRIKHSLLNLSNIFNESNKLIGDLANSLLSNTCLEKNESKYVLDRQIFLQSAEIVQQRVINDIFFKMKVSLKKIGYQKYKDILQFIRSEENNDFYYISSNLILYKEDGKLIIEIPEQNQLYDKDGDDEYNENLAEKFCEVKLDVPGITELSILGSKIEARIIENKQGLLEKFTTTKTKDEEAIDMSKVCLPLFARLRKPGDYFWPIGAKGKKKLKDFFIDIKIDKYERDRIPILISKEHPVWVVGLRIDNRVKVSETTKNILILKYSRL